jgi:hypothetical protein
MWRCFTRKALGWLIHIKHKRRNRRLVISAEGGENKVMEFVIHFHFNFDWDQEMWQKETLIHKMLVYRENAKIRLRYS